eukprot:COSAG01_NODE_54996_length_328_cov_0.877729_1_plen_65_part_01
MPDTPRRQGAAEQGGVGRSSLHAPLVHSQQRSAVRPRTLRQSLTGVRGEGHTMSGSLLLSELPAH